MDTPAQQLAERVRALCLQTALDAWEDAGVQGLCAEGRWEVAMGALQQLNLAQALAEPPAPAAPPPDR
jgi:hypothetical protein